MTVGIYGIFDATTNECLYVGQSKEIEVRFRQHITKLKNKRSNALKSFVDWYHDQGAIEASMILKILESCPNKRLVKNQVEAKWFDKLEPRFYGKIPSLSETWDHTEMTRLKIAESVRRSRGNFTGVSIPKQVDGDNQKSNPKSTLKQNKKNAEDIEAARKNKAEIAISVESHFDEEWKDQIISWYVLENLSCREIARRIGADTKVNIPRQLRRYGIEVKPRTFNGHTLSEDMKKKIADDNKSRAMQNNNLIACMNCHITFHFRPSQNRRFCSKNCRWDYDSEHCDFPEPEILAEELSQSSFYLVSKKYGNPALIRRYLKNNLSEDHPVFFVPRVLQNSANV